MLDRINVVKQFRQRSLLHFSDSFDSMIVINRYGFAKINSRFRVEFVARIVHYDAKRIFIHPGFPLKPRRRCSLAVHDRMGILIHTRFGRRLARIGRNGT